MKTRKNFVRFALALALVISMMAVMSVGAAAYTDDMVIPITTQPVGQNISYGKTATFSVTTSNSQVVYQWYFATSETGNGTAIEGATTNSYTTPVLTQSNSSSIIGYYYCIISSTSEYVPATVCTSRAQLTYVDTYLNLDDSDSSSTTVAQNYNLTLSGGSYTDVTKVKVEWSTTDISATRTDNKTWNPNTLSWDATTDTNTVTVSQNGGATFTLTNLSSVSVNATVTFAQVTGFSAPTVVYTEDGTEGDGAAAIGTVVNSDKTVTSANDHDAVIGVTVTPVASDFKALGAASDAQYGTYTVTIGAVS